MSLEPGFVLSHYRLIRRLGAGGMGEVYLAQDQRLDRHVAIKVLAAPTDAEARRRLLREARASAALDHPAICAIYEVGADATAGDFIVMQYLEGQTLAQRLQRGRLRVAEAATLSAEVAEALAAAHRRGVVHRDLKPQNIIVTPSGAPKLLDFGLAKRVDATRDAAEALTSSLVTQPYTVLGTLGYMAPEQIRAEATDVRSDLFSLGCVFYECLTGRRAFTGGTQADILAQTLHVEPAPPSTLAPEVTAAHDGVCARLLKKEVSARFQSAEEALGALRALLPPGYVRTDGAITPLPAPPPIKRDAPVPNRMIAVIAGLLAIVGAIGLWQWSLGALPDVPPEAARYYDRGVESLREGSYFAARTALQHAVDLHKGYPQAYARLAEAEAELDHDAGARDALLRLDALDASERRLSVEDELRVTAVRFGVLRDHDKAIAAYRQLAERRPKDAGGWLDLGRAEEAAWRRAAALEHYEQARKLDGAYAAAFVRIGALTAELGRTDTALKSFDEAARLYRASSNLEGEAEALLRKGIALSSLSRAAEAQPVLERVLEFDERFVFQRLRAQFELARVLSLRGQFTQAEALGMAAREAATKSGLPAVAANGIVDLAGVLARSKRVSEAQTLLTTAIELARNNGAPRAQMRAQLQQASIETELNPARALALSADPLAFYSKGRHFRNETAAYAVQARAYEQLEQYDQAERISVDRLAMARSIGDEGLIATHLENLAGQLTKLGRLPEAVVKREEIVGIHRRLGDHTNLGLGLNNAAELLIQLGNKTEALRKLDEVDARIAAADEAYTQRLRRVKLLRAWLAATEHRFADVVPLAKAAAATETPDSTSRMAVVLTEHALAHQGQSRESAALIAGWPLATPLPVLRRELSYWVADTLLARKDYRAAFDVAFAAWSDAGGAANHELRWRLASVALLALRGLPAVPNGATIPPSFKPDLDQLAGEWGPAAVELYFRRPDLAALRRKVS